MGILIQIRWNGWKHGDVRFTAQTFRATSIFH